MSSTKNTIILGCFILVAVFVHCYIDRYEPGKVGDGEMFRFDKLTGYYQFYTADGWKDQHLDAWNDEVFGR